MAVLCSYHSMNKLSSKKLSDHFTKLYNSPGGERLYFYLAIDGTKVAQAKQVSGKYR